jgi:prolyl-tRNA editing enzyme YbaK/EbsC (Cys-tRNA(Pro) deacylase)
MQAATGMQVGGVTPFSLPAEWPLYVDKRVMQLEWVVLGGGGRDTKIKIRSSVFSQLGAEVVLDLAIERTAPAS